MNRTWRKYTRPLAGILVLLGLWELLPEVGLVDHELVPPFGQVMGDFPSLLSSTGFGAAMLSTTINWGVGVVSAVLLGAPLGMVMGRSEFVFRALNRPIGLLYSIPKVGLVVPLVLIFGVGLLSVGGVVFLGCLIPIITSAYQGSKMTAIEHLWAARSVGIPNWMIGVRVVLPSTLPHLISGVRLAVAVGLLDVLGAQFVVRQSGIGAYLYDNFDVGQFVRVWSTATVVAALGLIADLLYVYVTKKMFPWAT
jgi:ABC-type nitrate/sulfonate/bicarbonate transport system permease component